MNLNARKAVHSPELPPQTDADMDNTQLIFTPDNEPYLGLETLQAFDNAIVACLKLNSQIAPLTHDIQQNDIQRAACQLIPAGINLALSLRELLRQGYLYGAAVMIRPLAERAVTILYLKHYPDKLQSGMMVGITASDQHLPRCSMTSEVTDFRVAVLRSRVP